MCVMVTKIAKTTMCFCDSPCLFFDVASSHEPPLDLRRRPFPERDAFLARDSRPNSKWGRAVGAGWPRQPRALKGSLRVGLARVRDTSPHPFGEVNRVLSHSSLERASIEYRKLAVVLGGVEGGPEDKMSSVRDPTQKLGWMDVAGVALRVKDSDPRRVS